MSQKSGFLMVSNGFFIENVEHTLTKIIMVPIGPWEYDEIVALWV